MLNEVTIQTFAGNFPYSTDAKIFNLSKCQKFVHRVLLIKKPCSAKNESLITQYWTRQSQQLYIKKLDCKHSKGYNTTDGGRFNGSKTNVKKQLDPRKEFLLKMIGAKITYYRTLRDMSQKELAKRANMSVSSLSKIELGKYNNNVSVSSLFDIADGLQIDITMLVKFSNMEKSMWRKTLSKD